ncbi:hypothetical protein QTG54_007421 [Skeletonema marinoi]|uniref:Uncharacterized protein n=1 Tax=Skeletonema marinoi TaxID=267567 RepID=A0AAD8Y8Y3_9STRA|nr:hypothetical protein QTG54_007421 [Skeletonema marinoi]
MSKAPLPASARDINPSDIRKDPLSLDELRKIKSLIDVAKVSGASKQATSCQPLTGRRVMVPITSKAFFEGVLQPPIKDSGSSSSVTAAEEQIVINIGGGQLKEMTRVQACAYLDKQLNVLDKSNTSKTKKTKAKSTALKKGFLNNTKSKASDKKPASSQNKATISKEILSSEEAMFPLMEIREECDIRGNIVNAEVINMSNTMKRIDDRLKNEGDIAEAGEGAEIGKLLADTLKESEADITTGLDKIKLKEEQADNNVEPTQETPVSNEDYEAILQRLEELELLEEEDAKSKKVNKTSSKRLQSGGWSKGFLNANNKSTKKAQKEKHVKVDANVKTIPSTRSTMTSAETQVKNNTRVSFSSKNEVKEIPRIGLNKVPQRPIPATTSAATAADATLDSSSDLDPFTPRSTVPFEDNVFRGVVKERTSPIVKANDDQTAQGAGERKKLSRFAQQRLQRG